MIKLIEKLDMRKGLFRLWLLVSVLFCFGILVLAYNDYQDRSGFYSSSYAVYPYMESHCEAEVKQGSFVPQKAYNNCLNSLVLDNRKEGTMELVYIVLSVALGFPLFILGIGFAFFVFKDNGYNKKIVNGFLHLISFLMKPLKWVAEGFSEDKEIKK